MFKVYRITDVGSAFEEAVTETLGSAKAVLDSIFAGYIISGGKIVMRKNY